MPSLIQSTGNVSSASSSNSKAYASNLTPGSLLIVAIGAWKSTTNDAFVVGDISQSAGTAVLGPWSLDIQRNESESSGGFQWLNTAIFSAIVYGGGSCTVQVAGMPANAYSWMNITEWLGSWSEGRVSATNYGNSLSPTAGYAPRSNNVQTGGPALMFAAGASYSAANPTTYTEPGGWTSLFASTNGVADHTGESIYKLVTVDTYDEAYWSAPTDTGAQAVIAAYREASPPHSRKYDPTPWNLLHNTR